MSRHKQAESKLIISVYCSMHVLNWFKDAFHIEEIYLKYLVHQFKCLFSPVHPHRHAKIMFNKLSEHFMDQSSWHIKLTITLSLRLYVM
jgi:hypothetical protein